MKTQQKTMIVDDAAPVCQLIHDFLRSSGEFTVLAAFQALEEVGRLRPDIVGDGDVLRIARSG